MTRCSAADAGRTLSSCIHGVQVVVPQKMFVMYSQAASYPIHTLSLADATPLHDGPSRTVALQVHPQLLRHVSGHVGAAGQRPYMAAQVGGRKFTFRGSTEQDALEWMLALLNAASRRCA